MIVHTVIVGYDNFYSSCKFRKFSFPMSDPNSQDSSGIPTNRDENGLSRRKIGCVEGIKKSAKDAGNALMQQKLKSWQPVMSPRYALKRVQISTPFLLVG